VTVLLGRDPDRHFPSIQRFRIPTGLARRFWPGLALFVVAVGLVVVATSGSKVGLEALLAVGVGAPLLFALRRRPQRGVVLLVALMPFDGLRLITPLPSSASAWKEILVFAILGATFVAPPEARARGDRRRLPPWAPAVIGLVFLGLASAAVLGGQQAITGFRIDYFYILVAIAIWRCPLSVVEKDRVISVLMVTGIVTALVGIAQQGIGASRLHSLGYGYTTTIIQTGSHLRSFSTFGSTFEFAFFLMIVLLACIPCALGDTRRTRNVIFLACMPVFAVALLFTYTRGAWLGLAVGGLYLGIRRHRILLLAVPLGALAFAFLPGSIATSSFSSSSLGQRVTTWQEHFDSVLDHPLGEGIGASGAAAAKVAQLEAEGSTVNTSVPGTPTYQPDNWYFQALYTLGIPGLWLWLLLLASAFASASYVARSTSGLDSCFALGVGACVLAAVAASLVTTYFESFPANALFWIQIAAVSAGLPRTTRTWDSRPANSEWAGEVGTNPVGTTSPDSRTDASAF
jgi:O-antigen ligase